MNTEKGGGKRKLRFPRRKEEKVGEQKSSLSFPKHLRKIVSWKQKKERAAAVSCSFPFPQKRNSRLPPSFSHTERRKKTARRKRRKVGGRMRWRGGDRNDNKFGTCAGVTWRQNEPPRPAILSFSAPEKNLRLFPRLLSSLAWRPPR